MNVSSRRQRGASLLEVLCLVVGVVFLLFATCGGCSLLERKVLNQTWQRRAVEEATTFAAEQAWTYTGAPSCSTSAVDGRFPCTLTLGDGRVESLLCAGDALGLEHGCIIATPFVTGARRAAVVTGQ